MSVPSKPPEPEGVAGAPAPAEDVQHRRVKSEQDKDRDIETARQLFEEQLDFLDKEKAKLLQELPPLAPVASSEDLSSEEPDKDKQQQQQKKKDDADGGGERRAKAGSWQRSLGKYRGV